MTLGFELNNSHVFIAVAAAAAVDIRNALLLPIIAIIIAIRKCHTWENAAF